MRKYVDKLWKGIQERLAYFDKDGSTCWSEAPAEGIFSILQTIVDHKTAIQLKNLTKLCRIIKEDPKPGSKHAEDITTLSMSKRPSKWGPKFRTNSFMRRTTSTTVSNILNDK